MEGSLISWDAKYFEAFGSVLISANIAFRRPWTMDSVQVKHRVRTPVDRI